LKIKEVEGDLDKEINEKGVVEEFTETQNFVDLTQGFFFYSIFFLIYLRKKMVNFSILLLKI
jgi:hypothetical protein